MEKNITIPNDLLPDTVFVPPFLNKEPNQIFNVFQKNEYGKHELTGKIYHEQGRYIAKDNYGKQIFKDSIKLSAIKTTKTLNVLVIGYFTQRDPSRSVQTDPCFPTAFFNLITSVFCIFWRS